MARGWSPVARRAAAHPDTEPRLGQTEASPRGPVDRLATTAIPLRRRREPHSAARLRVAAPRLAWPTRPRRHALPPVRARNRGRWTAARKLPMLPARRDYCGAAAMAPSRPVAARAGRLSTHCVPLLRRLGVLLPPALLGALLL